jgi:DNA-binding NarL/FixJ family response regulator
MAIIDDHAMIRAGLRQFFADQSDVSVVAEAGTGREAIDIVRAGCVDVIVMDISMPVCAAWTRWPQQGQRARTAGAVTQRVP